MAVDLSNLLGKRSDEIEKPKPMPIGHYAFLVLGHEIVESSKKGTPGLQFEVQVQEAKEDVDEELLNEVKDWQKKKMRMTMWITEDTLWRIKEGFIKMGIEDDTKTLEELIPETTGAMFVAKIQHEQMDSGDTMAKIDDGSMQPYE